MKSFRKIFSIFHPSLPILLNSYIISCTLQNFTMLSLTLLYFHILSCTLPFSPVLSCIRETNKSWILTCLSYSSIFFKQLVYVCLSTTCLSYNTTSFYYSWIWARVGKCPSSLSWSSPTCCPEHPPVYCYSHLELSCL